jgi:hypothetical protein
MAGGIGNGMARTAKDGAVGYEAVSAVAHRLRGCTPATRTVSGVVSIGESMMCSLLFCSVSGGGGSGLSPPSRGPCACELADTYVYSVPTSLVGDCGPSVDAPPFLLG